MLPEHVDLVPVTASRLPRILLYPLHTENNIFLDLHIKNKVRFGSDGSFQCCGFANGPNHFE
jgi:hypothetical protein